MILRNDEDGAANWDAHVGTPIIEVNNLTYRYNDGLEDEVTALSGVSFSVKEGEFIALIGANGSGKSTLAKLLNGLYYPVSGSVTVYGIETTDEKRVFELRKNIGVVFQNPDNQMVATVIEDDIAFGPENLGLPPKEINERVDWALGAVGMGGFRKGTPFRLSGGQKQRIAIAGVLAIKPRILVLDEATAMLDPRGKREVLGVVKDLVKKEGMTVIMITHYPEEAAEADRIIVLSSGRIAADGAPAEVFDDIEMLRSVSVDAPLPARVAHALRQRGCDIGRGIITGQQLAEALCGLK